MQIVHMNLTIDHTKPKLVSLSVNVASLNSTAGLPHRKRVDMVIPTNRFFFFWVNE